MIISDDYFRLSFGICPRYFLASSTHSTLQENLKDVKSSMVYDRNLIGCDIKSFFFDGQIARIGFNSLLNTLLFLNTVFYTKVIGHL
jgi:hypothetical protein